MNLRKNILLWLQLAGISFRIFIISRLSTVLFLTGKILRIAIYMVFLFFLVKKTGVLGDYGIWQVMLFYMTFNLIDATSQMLFREVYRFRELIVYGTFDSILLKPVSSLFRSLFGWTDLLDFFTILPFVASIVFIFSKIGNISFFDYIAYAFLIINSLVIAASFHIIVLSLSVMNIQTDQSLLLYRDITSMGRIPVSVYEEPVRSFITFVVPVGIMMYFPAENLLNPLESGVLLYSFGFSAISLLLSLKFWNFSLRRYTSVSS